MAAEDQQPIPLSTSPKEGLADLRAGLEVLEKQVSDLIQQPPTPAATASDSGLEDRVWGFETDQLTDSSVAFGDSGGVAVIWKGDRAGVSAAQQALVHRAQCNRNTHRG